MQRAHITASGWRLIGVESLQWCANNAVYFLGLIGIATYDLEGGALLVAGITLVRNLATSLGNMGAGVAIDRWGPRFITLLTLAFTVIASLIVGLVPTTTGVLFAAAVFLGISGGCINTCTHAFPGYLEPDPKSRQQLNGLMMFYSNIAYTLGPIVGGALVAVFPTRSVYLFMAVLMAAAFLLAWRCKEVRRPMSEAATSQSALARIGDGARLTFASVGLSVIFFSGFFGNFAFGAFDSLESLFYRDVLRVDIVWLGFLSSVVGLTSSIGSYLLTRVPVGFADIRTLLASLLLVGIGSMVYVGTDILAIAILGQAINGLAWGFLEPLQMSLVQERAPLEHLGTVMGFVRFGLMSAGVLPVLAAPALADAFGVQSVLFGASALIAAIALLSLIWWSRLEHK